MGVKIENVSSDLAKELGLPYSQGALVREVLPESSAAKAGIQAGDVIIQFNNKPIEDASALSLEAGMAGVGTKVPVKVFRDGKSLTLSVTLEALNKEEPLAKEDRKDLEELGLIMQGTKVVEVKPGSMAAMSGIEKDDVMIKVNNQPIKDAESLSALVKKVPAGGFLKIFLKRAQSTVFVVLQKP